MKYNSYNKPIVCMQTHSTNYQQTSKMKVLGVLWHSTGANNKTLKRYVQPHESDKNYNEMIKLLGKNKYNNDYNHITVYVGMNAFIGTLANGEVATVQTMPWDYRPWGCGGGKYGSCNDGYIQFEIAESDLNDESYFNQVYQEACELTAYVCKLYNIDPKGTVTKNGRKIPAITCHVEANQLGFASGHGDVLHWFKRYGKDMEDIRNDVSKLMGNTTNVSSPTMYRIRTSWNMPSTQKGAYTNLDKAINHCETLSNDYKVFDSSGKIVYQQKATAPNNNVIKIGEKVDLKPDATYYNGATIPKWVIGIPMYIREVRDDGNIVISSLKTGPITGVVKPEAIQWKEIPKEKKVKINTSVLNVRQEPNINSKRIGKVRRNQVYTIEKEENGFGKIKLGWINLIFTEDVK